MENKAFGIDLGTTYSCIAYVDDMSGEPVLVDNIEGDNVTPSVVYFDEEGGYTAGEIAKETAVITPDRVCDFVKRKMGDPDYKIAISVDGTDYSPETVSSFILTKMVKDAEEQLGCEIKDVVITCPAYFGIAERTATQTAGELAGLNVLEIINEPTAAALCYGCLRDVDDKNILVYDLGGGTFDVTIIHVTPEEIAAVATDGNHQLGGKNWDELISDYLENEFREQKEFQDELTPEDYQELRLKAERAKQQLTGKAATKAILSLAGLKATIELTRETFDSVTSALLSQTIDLTKSTMEAAAKKGVTAIDEIILVGGSSKMPQVKAAVEKEFEGVPIKMYEPNAAVAKGAAIHADNIKKGKADLQKWNDDLIDIIKDIQRESKTDVENAINDKGEVVVDNISEKAKEEIVKRAEEKGLDSEAIHKVLLGGVSGKKAPVPVLRNITSKSMGIEVMHNVGTDTQENWQPYIANLIKKQDSVPVNITQKFPTFEDNMESVLLKVYETDVEEDLFSIEGYEPLGEVELPLPPNVPGGTLIDVTLELSTDGLLTARGHEPITNETREGVMQSASIMTEEEKQQQRSAAKGLKYHG